MDEIWKVISSDPRYEVSNLGRVRNAKTHRIRSQHLDTCGYSVITGLNIHTCRVARLVADAFIPNPLNKDTVNHIDGVKTNNCVSNLEWATRSEQMLHAYKMGLKQPVVRQNQILTDEQAQEIKRLYVPHSKEFGMQALAAKYGCSVCTIKRCATGKTYRGQDNV